jgi:hypothetical protein
VTVRPRTLLLSLLAILLLVMVMASVPFLSDPDYAKKLILSQVEQQIGRKIEVGQAHLEIIPKIRLELSQVVIRDLDTSQVFFRAKRMDLVLRMTPLWRLQVVGKRLKVEEPQVELRRDRAGHWNFLSGAGGEVGSTQAEGNPLALLLRIRETTVTNGEVTIVDEFRQDGIRSLQVRTLDAIISTASKGLAVDVRLSATIPATLGVSSLSLVGKVTQADRAVRVAPDGPAGNVPGVQFEGVAEALHVDLQQVAGFFGPLPVSEHMSGSANLLGRVRLAPGVVGYDMVLSDMTAKVQRMSLKGQASLSGLMTAQPTFSVTFSSSPVDLGELLDRLPAEWLRPKLRTVVTEREIGGTIEVVTATVSGTTTPEPRVSVTGEFRVHQGHALIGRDRTLAQNVSGTVIVEPDRIRLTDLTGLYGHMRVSGGTATVSLTEPSPVVDLELAGDMAAADLVAALARIVRLEPLANVLAGLREIQGDTLLTYRVAGPLDSPDGLSFVGGEFVPRDVSFRTTVVSERVTGLKGRVLVSPKRVEFDKVAGRMGQSQFEVQGIVTAGAGSTFQGLTVQMRAEAAQLVRMLPEGAVSSTALQGTIGATVSLSGLTSAPQFKAVMELKDTELSVAGVVRKPVGTPASLQVEGSLSRDSLLSADRIELTIPPVRLSGKGSMRLGKKFGVDATFVSGPIDLAKLPPVIESGGIKAGTLEVSLDVKGKQRDWKTWQINGWVAITDGQITTKDHGHPVKDLYVRLKLVRNGADLKRLAFRIKDNDVRLSGSIRNWHQTPAITLKAESAKLDFDLLIPKGGRSPLRDFLETLASTSRLVATVAIDRGVYRQFTFTELTCRVNIRDGVLDVDRLNGQSDGGRVAGRLVVRLPREKPAEAEASVRIEGVPFLKLSQLMGEKHLVSGELSATATVQGHGRHPRGVLPTLNGKVELLIKQGRIQKGTIVPKIVMLLNLPMLLQGKIDLTRDGMPFDKMSATFSVRDGVLSSENMVVDSPVIKLSGAGKYDLTTDQLDAIMAASPLGAYSQFLKSIPLFGKLFAGERKGIDTALFTVKGSLQGPKVTYLPLKSFATGLTGLAQLAVDVLKNTILLPKELISPADERAPEPATDQAPPSLVKENAPRSGETDHVVPPPQIDQVPQSTVPSSP